MRNIMKRLSVTLLTTGMCAGFYASNAIADDDVAALVVDNGGPVSVSEPSVLALLALGVVGIAVVKLRNRKK